MQRYWPAYVNCTFFRESDDTRAWLRTTMFLSRLCSRGEKTGQFIRPESTSGSVLVGPARGDAERRKEGKTRGGGREEEGLTGDLRGLIRNDPFQGGSSFSYYCRLFHTDPGSELCTLPKQTARHPELIEQERDVKKSCRKRINNAGGAS